MIEDGNHTGIIQRVSTYNNPSGPDKLIVDIELEDGTLFSYFFTPGFPSFDQLLVVAGKEPKKVEDEFEEENLLSKKVDFTTKITEAKNGNEYCNVESIKKADENGESVAEDINGKPFPDSETNSEEKKTGESV